MAKKKIDLANTSKKYFSIREVSSHFGITETNLRYWEKEFDIISPKRNKSDVRVYSKADISNIGLVYHLLEEKKYTHEGAKQVLKDNKSKTKAQTNSFVIEKLENIKAEIKGLISALNDIKK